jgi:predicted kinase
MWCDLVAAKMYSLSPPDAVGVLPVLELPYGVVRERAHVTARAAGVPAELIMSELPGQVIVETALSSRSDYWVDLAAGWLRDMPAEQVPFGAIEEAAHDTALPQSSRHGLLRALSQVRSR